MPGYGASLLNVDLSPVPTVTHRDGHRIYYVAKAGDRFYIELRGPIGRMKGAVVQIDGKPTDWTKLPFTYFKRGKYILEGSWTNPLRGEMMGWTFGVPAKSDEPGAASSNVGVIKVYFFSNLERIHRSTMNSDMYDYESPKVPVDTKLRDASLGVIHGKRHIKSPSGEWAYKIMHRNQYVKVITIYYASADQLQVMGHKPGTSSFSTPSPTKKRRVEKDDDEDDVEEVAGPAKPPPEVIVVDD